MPLALFAHGFADASDLGLPPALLLGGGAAVVVGTAALLSALDARRGLDRQEPRVRPIATPLATLLDHAVTRGLLKALGVLLLAFLLYTATFGDASSALNPAPRLLFTGLWAGLVVLASMMAGPLWRVMNPLPLISAAIARVSGDRQERGLRQPPEWLGVWPAAAALLVFTVAEHAYPSEPSTVRVFLALYVLAMLAGATIYGAPWRSAGDAFEVTAVTLGQLAPLGRSSESGSWSGGGSRPELSGLVWRNPVRALAALPVRPGLAVFLGVLLGGNLFDGIQETGTWARWDTTMLISVVGVVGVAAACALVLWAIGERRPYLLPAFVPVVAGYALAHYLAPLLVDTQILAGQLGDPLGRTTELVFAPEPSASYTFVPAALVAGVQLAALVGGHVLAVIVAHRAATARFDLRASRAVQFPLRGVLVASVVLGIALRFPPG